MSQSGWTGQKVQDGALILSIQMPTWSNLSSIRTNNKKRQLTRNKKHRAESAEFEQHNI
jgi:hypothetical protein